MAQRGERWNRAEQRKTQQADAQKRKEVAVGLLNLKAFHTKDSIHVGRSYPDSFLLRRD